MRQADEEAIRQRLTDLFAGWSPGAGDFDMGRVAAFYTKATASWHWTR